MARGHALLRVAKRADWTSLSPADRSRVGARRARRPRTKTISLGRRSSAISAQLRDALANRARASRAVRSQRLWPLRYRRQRARVVQRLVRPELLRRIAGAQSTRAGAKPDEAPAQIVSRRIMATPHQGRPLFRAIEHPSGIPIRRLRISCCVQLVTLPYNLSFRTGRSPVRNLLFAGAIQNSEVPCSVPTFSKTNASS